MRIASALIWSLSLGVGKGANEGCVAEKKSVTSNFPEGNSFLTSPTCPENLGIGTASVDYSSMYGATVKINGGESFRSISTVSISDPKEVINFFSHNWLFHDAVTKHSSCTVEKERGETQYHINGESLSNILSDRSIKIPSNSKKILEEFNKIVQECPSKSGKWHFMVMHHSAGQPSQVIYPHVHVSRLAHRGVIYSMSVSQDADQSTGIINEGTMLTKKEHTGFTIDYRLMNSEGNSEQITRFGNDHLVAFNGESVHIGPTKASEQGRVLFTLVDTSKDVFQMYCE